MPDYEGMILDRQLEEIHPTGTAEGEEFDPIEFDQYQARAIPKRSNNSH